MRIIYTINFFYLGVSERLKRKTVQRLAVDKTLGKTTSGGKITKPVEADIFELPAMPEALDTEEDDGYLELPIHNMLYSGDIDVSQVCCSSLTTLD